MEKIEKNAKKYEELSLKADKNYNKIINVIPIVIKFIIDNDLILYGGSAIDYALRIKGDCIYPDDSIPDLDFYSYDNIAHAYNLADILYKMGNKEVRAIRALYVQTMRIDLIDNNFIADITYVSKNIFETLPTLIYNGIKIIHPLFQKIDLHRSLSFPYEYAPNEAIFARWKKDILRFNKLHKYYPSEHSKEKIIMHEHKLPLKYIKDNVVGGFIAYAILYKDLQLMIRKFNIKSPPNNIIAANIKINGSNLIFDAPPSIETYLFSTKMPKHAIKYNAYMSIMPKSGLIEQDNEKIRIFAFKNKLLAANKSVIDNTTITHLNVQGLLFTLLFAAHFSKKAIFYNFYESVLEMINIAAAIISTIKSNKKNDFVLNCPFFPSINTFGTENKSDSYDILINGIKVALGEAEPFYAPINYYPENKNRPLPFVYERSKFFNKNGKKIELNK